MRGLLFLILFASVLVLTTCKKEKAAEPQVFGKFKGTVYDEFNHPLNGVSIKFDDGNANTSLTTGLDGSFFIGGIPAQQHQVSISKDNYIAQTFKVNIPANGTDSINVILKAGIAFVKSSQDSIVVNADAGDVVLNIKSNTSWVATNSSGFIKLTQSVNSGEGTLNVKYLADTGLKVRM